MGSVEWARWDAAHPDHFRKAQRERKAAMVEMMGGACEDCGFDLTAFPMCADFDHVDPTDKLFAVSAGLTKTANMIVEELLKCRLLCANCHRVRTAKYDLRV